MKIKTTTQSVIDTTRYMAEYSPEPKAIIDGVCKTHKITQDFIREFSQYITPEMFMSSYKLSKTMVDANPHLFSSDNFKELFKSGYTDADTGEFIENMNIPDISLSMLAEYYSDFKNSDDYAIDEGYILNTIRTSTDDEINESEIINLLGISREIDDLLLKRIKDDELRDTLILTLQIEGNATTSATYKYMSNEVKENLIGDDEADVEEFVKAITESKDLGWKVKMIEKAVSGEIKFEINRKVFDNELVAALSQLPEDQVVKMTKLSDKMPNAFSYKTMMWLLENKEFSEEDLIEMKDVFKKAGLYFNLVKLAKQNNYNKLTEELKK